MLNPAPRKRRRLWNRDGENRRRSASDAVLVDALEVIVVLGTGEDGKILEACLSIRGRGEICKVPASVRRTEDIVARDRNRCAGHRIPAQVHLVGTRLA